MYKLSMGLACASIGSCALTSGAFSNYALSPHGISADDSAKHLEFMYIF